MPLHVCSTQRKNGGMDLFYNQYGDDGPPLIILHGLLGANGNWHTLSRTAFSEVATVYAVDQRNHGRSPHTSEMDYRSMAEDVDAFADQHDLDSVDLLGHSMGGKTAMQTALTYPTRVDRLIIVDMAPRAYPPHHADLLEALAGIDPSDYEDRDEVDTVLAEDVPEWAIRQFLLKNLKYDGERYSWTMNLGAIREHYDQIRGALPADGTFPGPTLVVRGGRSDYVSEDDRSAFQARFPNMEMVTIEDAGHWVHADAPEAFADVVVDFLSRE